MNIALSIVLVLNAFVAIHSLEPQKKGKPGVTPGFTGTWVSDPAAPTATTVDIKVGEEEVTIVRSGRGGPIATSYKYDGTPVERPGPGGDLVQSTLKAGTESFVITTKGSVGETSQTWTLSGDTLVVENTGARGPSKVSYRRQKTL